MKILPIEKVREADAYTIREEPIASIDLMERAAATCAEWISERLKPYNSVKVFCGTGNNGGDGLATARILGQREVNVKVYVVRISEKTSSDFDINLQRLTNTRVPVYEIGVSSPMPEIDPDDVIVDALFGSGLSKPVEGLAAEVIKHINQSERLVVSIDIPSGLFADVHTDAKKGMVIKADYTLSFQFPKYSFLFPENEQYVGEWHVLPIGLHPGYIDSVEAKNCLIESSIVQSIYKPRSKFAHKGYFGHALLIAGGYGKMGAAVLASRACLKTGVGLLHSHIPAKGYSIIQTAVPEAMVTIDPDEDYFSRIPEISAFNAIAVGPGIGFAEKTKGALKMLIQEAKVPIVFDADALTILGENKTWLSFVPKLSVFTPHPKEFERLVGYSENDFERNKLQREFSFKYSAYVVLKGAHTAITCPDGTCYFNSTGNPGMATAGSGDVLTGMILSLLAQGYPPKHACIMGVFLHGLAGDISSENEGFEATTSQSIIDNIGAAFRSILPG